MTNLTDTLNQLELGVQNLLHKKEELDEKVRILENRVNTLESELIEKNETVKDLMHQMNIRKMAKEIFTGADDGKETKQKINELLREIDKCIALLNE
jgi:uncharacterized coiled-coil DUF342 family protein